MTAPIDFESNTWLFDASIQEPLHEELAVEFDTDTTMVRSAAFNAIFSSPLPNPTTMEEWKERVRVELRSNLAAIAAQEKVYQKKRREELKLRVPTPATRVQPARRVVRKLHLGC